MRRRSLAARLATLYAMLLGVTVAIVIAASSIALILELAGFSNDILIAKHEEARFLADRMQSEGLTFTQAAPRIVSAVSGIGLRVAIYDTHGKFIAGDKDVHPPILADVLRGQVKLPQEQHAGGSVEFARPGTRAVVLPGGPPPQPIGGPGGRRKWLSIAAVTGGYVAFEPSTWLILTNLIPYWWIVFGIAVVAITGSWFIGVFFSREALAPVNEVTESLRALAGGDYTQRRFVTARGDEIATLTHAYNDAAASVAAAMEERKTTEARMRQFVADAGHELRTPLTVIGGYIDVLRRGAISETNVARQILGTMSLEREHMRTLIDRLMRLARMDADTPPSLQKVNVAEFLRDQVEAARRMDETRHIDYCVDGVADVIADRMELSEAVWNVVENALKYAPDAPIHLSAVKTDGYTTLSVRDEGPGMNEFERMHAFERFYRGESRGEITGSGLGLAIAKRAVERAGGSIEIDSAPGRGTTVLMKFKT